MRYKKLQSPYSSYNLGDSFLMNFNFMGKYKKKWFSNEPTQHGIQETKFTYFFHIPYSLHSKSETNVSGFIDVVWGKLNFALFVWDIGKTYWLHFLCKGYGKQLPSILLMVFFTKFSSHGASTLGGETFPNRKLCGFRKFWRFRESLWIRKLKNL